MKNVVTKHETCRVIANELFTDYECLSQSIRRRLLRIRESDPIIAAVAEKMLEHWQVKRGGDYKYIPDSGKHKRGYGIIDHRFVKNGEKLFAHTFGDGIQSGAGAAGKNNTFHSLFWCSGVIRDYYMVGITCLCTCR